MNKPHVLPSFADYRRQDRIVEAAYLRMEDIAVEVECAPPAEQELRKPEIEAAYQAYVAEQIKLDDLDRVLTEQMDPEFLAFYAERPFSEC
jgi:hypothetical protein